MKAYLIAAWSRPLSEAKLAEFTADPWQIFLARGTRGRPRCDRSRLKPGRRFTWSR